MGDSLRVGLVEGADGEAGTYYIFSREMPGQAQDEIAALVAAPVEQVAVDKSEEIGEIEDDRPLWQKRLDVSRHYLRHYLPDEVRPINALAPHLHPHTCAHPDIAFCHLPSGRGQRRMGQL